MKGCAIFMADIKKIAEVGKFVLNNGKELIKDEAFVDLLCGRYADGTQRNITDAVKGEYLSPKQKEKATTKKKKKKKSTKFKL